MKRNKTVYHLTVEEKGFGRKSMAFHSKAAIYRQLPPKSFERKFVAMAFPGDFLRITRKEKESRIYIEVL